MLKPLSSIDASIRAKSLTWIARQINACLKEHDTCEDTSVSNLPTRVVDVNYAPQRVRIIPTNGASGTYITLSHFWGDPGLMNTKLTAHNLEEYMNEGISIEDLPRTFRDAVELTKDLGVSYLWIDSLCIVQADPSKDMESHTKMVREDWERESASMCTIFAGSYVTLGAMVSPDCQGGLFAPVEHRVISADTLPDGSHSYLYAEEHHNHNEKYLLESRAWVYQETLVSSRTLYFLGREAMLLCRDYHSSQCGRRGLASGPSMDGAGRQTAFFKLPARATKHGAGTQLDTSVSRVKNKFDKSLPWAKWQLLVARYGHQTDISFASDRLIAIEGLAGYLQHMRPGERYFGGVWSGSFTKDLLWTIRIHGHERLRVGPDTIKTNRSSEKWLFPTWSWASLSDERHRINVRYIDFSERVNLSLHGPGSDEEQLYQDSAFLLRPVGEPFAQNKIANGQQKPQHPTEKRRYYELKVEGILVPIPRSLLFTGEVGMFLPKIHCNWRHFWCDFGLLAFHDWFCKEYPEGSAEPTFYCLRMMNYIGRSGHYMGLVLRCVDEENQLYERLGVWEQRYVLKMGDPEEFLDEHSSAKKRNWKPNWWQEEGAEAEPEPRVISLV
ncbi:uncharacterized protein B0T23DRAFT_247729 [Neurospora hispaniola]|uniref:Heterokaryon incompatibility domain-containing protein n=1 Tax=Neurospora hispaniola TaxID=588809 RepID=A0AAJ0I0J6_9PEZI|nr:hypothetical protein B0T23DRAFT_247729 [Neurospora hispaniola]